MRIIIQTILATFIATASFAQNTEIAFGGLEHDASAPVEVTADGLSIDQSTGRAVFSGSVLVVQGDLRLSSNSVEVAYGTSSDTSDITSLTASGNVLFVTETDEAQADTAVYDVANGTVQMTGNVLLSQGPAVVSSEAMFINLETGAATLSGRVKTTLHSSSNQQ